MRTTMETWLKELYELPEYKNIHLTRPPEKEVEYIYMFTKITIT